MTGIGCSSKTTAYFVSGSRTASTPCTAACRRSRGRERREPRTRLHRHLRRRRLAVDRPRAVLSRDPSQRRHAVHHREQRRVRPHQGAVLRLRGHRHQVARSGETNVQPPIDPVLLALSLGAHVRRARLLRRQARSCRCSRRALRTKASRSIDVHLAVRDLQRSRRLDEELRYTREHYRRGWRPSTSCRWSARSRPRRSGGRACPSATMHDGSIVRFREVVEATVRSDADRDARIRTLSTRAQERGEIVTGLLYIDESSADMHEIANNCKSPARRHPVRETVPGPYVSRSKP